MSNQTKCNVILYLLHLRQGKMAKRAYPFEFGLYRQLKVHIDTFEYDEAAVREIERKTVETLFMAQKKNPGTCENNGEADSSSKHKSFRQRQLTSYFFGINGIPLDVKNADLSTAMEICVYCEKKSDNISKCSICLQRNCHSCSFPDYNSEFDEARICLSCS